MVPYYVDFLQDSISPLGLGLIPISFLEFESFYSGSRYCASDFEIGPILGPLPLACSGLEFLPSLLSEGVGGCVEE